ncbi:MAG TPA: hypothetical protein VHB21_21075, partial [Minicystis sp.]|nr:hypothetical protein [Minicystis sp.]
SFCGTVPFGSLAAGAAAARFGAPDTLFVEGLVVVFAGLLFLRALPRIRAAARAAHEIAGEPIAAGPASGPPAGVAAPPDA